MKHQLRLTPILFIAAAFVFTPLTSASGSDAPLRSPWDATPVAATQQPYDCGAMTFISPDISITDGPDASNDAVSDSVKAAAFAESGGALDDLMRRTIGAADIYRDTGSLAAAQCVGQLLASAAADHAMAGVMGSLVAWQAQNRALRSLAIAYLKVRDSNAIPPAQNTAILAWMNDILHQERKFYEHTSCNRRKCDILGHRGLEVAMASAAIGVATNDRGEFKRAVDQYRTAVEHIGPHGMLHYDSRGRYALKFHIESAASLIQIAEFAEANNEPLYEYHHGYIHLLVHTVSRGLVDPQPFVAADGRQQQLLPSPMEPWEISWASVYNNRFPDPVITSLLQQIGPGGADMWGGESLSPDAADTE